MNNTPVRDSHDVGDRRMFAKTIAVQEALPDG